MNKSRLDDDGAGQVALQAAICRSRRDGQLEFNDVWLARLNAAARHDLGLVVLELRIDELN